MNSKILKLAVGTLALMFLGLLYAWSVFVKPLESALGFTAAETANIFTVSMITFCLGGVLGGILQKKIKPQALIIMIALVLAVGFILSSTVTKIYEIYLYYGVFCGLAVGVGYNVILSVIVKWFPGKAPLVSGIMLMGYGAGGFLLSAAAAAAITQFGISQAFVIIGVAVGVILILFSFFITNPKTEPEASKNSAKAPEADVETRVMIKKPDFWVAYIWAVLMVGIGLAVIGKASPIAQAAGMSVELAVIAVGTISVLNGAGRIITGAIYPRTGYKNIMRGVCVLFSLSAAVILTSLLSASSILIFPGFALLGLAYGAVPSFMVSFIRTSFGAKHYPVNMSTANTSPIFSALLGSTLLGYLTSATGTYTYTLIIAFFTAIVWLIIPLVLKAAKYWRIKK